MAPQQRKFAQSRPLAGAIIGAFQSGRPCNALAGSAVRYATHANGVDGRAPGAARVLAATDGGDRHIGASLCDAAARWLECGKGGLSVGFLFGADTLQGFPPSAVVIALGLRLLALPPASATFALKAGLWFRRGGLVIVSPVPGIMPRSGRKSTYASCPDSPSQFCNTEVTQCERRSLGSKAPRNHAHERGRPQNPLTNLPRFRRQGRSGVLGSQA